jgi:hypothetical protein
MYGHEVWPAEDESLAPRKFLSFLEDTDEHGFGNTSLR